MNEFAASNGVIVAPLETSIGARLTVHDPEPAKREGYTVTTHTVYLDPREVDALRGWARAEEDARLGRWRWPEDPRFVVYRWANDGSRIVIIDEATGGQFDTSRTTLAGSDHWATVARAYFDAHPEPKPAWADAKPKDVWEFRSEDDRRRALGWVAMDGTWDIIDPRGRLIDDASDPIAALDEFGYPEFASGTAVKYTPEGDQ